MSREADRSLSNAVPDTLRTPNRNATNKIPLRSSLKLCNLEDNRTHSTKDIWVIKIANTIARSLSLKQQEEFLFCRLHFSLEVFNNDVFFGILRKLRKWYNYIFGICIGCNIIPVSVELRGIHAAPSIRWAGKLRGIHAAPSWRMSWQWRGRWAGKWAGKIFGLSI